MASTCAPAALLAAALTFGCSGAIPRTLPAAAPTPRQEGDPAWSRGEYAVALAKYREAVRAAPHDLTLRFTVTSTLVTLLAAKLVSGCGGHPTPRAPAQTPPALETSSRQEGDAALSRGDYATAVAKYREALRVTPDDLKLRFALGSAPSHLDQRDETIEQFRWVVEHRAPEIAIAREWLAAVERASPAGGSLGRRGISGLAVPGPEPQPAPARGGISKGKTGLAGVSPRAPTHLRRQR